MYWGCVESAETCPKPSLLALPEFVQAFDCGAGKPFVVGRKTLVTGPVVKPDPSVAYSSMTSAVAVDVRPAKVSARHIGERCV